MKKYVASDFMTADLNITSIHGIWHGSAATWSRPKKIPRDYDGLLYFVSGSIRYFFGDMTFEAHAGQILRLPSGVPYTGIKLSSEPLNFYVIDFVSEKEGEFNSYPLPYSFYPSDNEQIKRMFVALEKKWNTPSACYMLDCKRDVIDLISYLTKDFANNICRYDSHNRSLQIREFITQNAHITSFHIEDVARNFHMSQTHIRRIFDHEFGISPVEYLISVRIEKAKRMLVSERDSSIEEIAEQCGYSSLYYFSNTFKRKVGISPSAYRSAIMI